MTTITASTAATNEFRVISCTPMEQPKLYPKGTTKLTYRSGVDGQNDWALICNDIDNARVWLVMLHGHGAKGDQIFTRPDIRPWQQTISKHGMAILSPNLRGNAWMGPAATQDLHALLAHVRRDYGAETFIFASASMGGTGSLLYAVLHPEDVAAVVALCPATDMAAYHAWATHRSTPILQEIATAIQQSYGGTPNDVPEVYAARSALAHCETLTMPLTMAHGDSDATIPIKQSRQLVERLHLRGIDVSYKEILGGGHDAPLLEFETALNDVVKRLIEVV